MDYDEDRIYLSYQNLQATNENSDDLRGTDLNGDDFDNDNVNLHAVKRHFREFLRKCSIDYHNSDESPTRLSKQKQAGADYISLKTLVILTLTTLVTLSWFHFLDVGLTV